MASGALMSLVAYGAQDVYLTGNPQITHFKVVYRRHTNFALETIELPMNSTCNFGTRSTVCITRNGDLISNVYLQVKLAQVTPSDGSKFAWVRRVGHALIKYVQVDIGGSCIDKQYGVWLNIWYDLAHHAGDGERGFFKLIGDVPELTTYDENNKCEYTLYIPLQFWFNRHYGLALPLIALQYHEVKLQFQFAERSDVVVANRCFKERDMSQIQMKDCCVLVKYVFLDSEERRRFAQVGHEYLIEQVQTEDGESIQGTQNKYQLDFNHPTKELVWAIKNGNFARGKAFPFYTGNDDWECALDEAAKKIVSESIIVTDCKSCDCLTRDDTCRGDHDVQEVTAYGALGSSGNGDEVPKIGECPDCNGKSVKPSCNPNDDSNGVGAWELVAPGKSGRTANGKWKVDNQSTEDNGCCVWVNTDSLSVDPNLVKTRGAGKNLGISNKICATITIDECCNITISDVEHDLTVRDLSYPVECLADGRNQSQVDDPCVVQCNFGSLIDGTVNPVKDAKLQINGHDREERREGAYFNYLQTDQHHTNTPADGINVYSFALYPELHQPSGTTNLSRIDNTQLCITVGDQTKGCNAELPDLCFLNQDNQIWIFAFSYNVLRIL